MTWNNLTVEQYQEVFKISSDKELNDIEKQSAVICLLLDITPKQLNELTLEEYRAKAKEIAFFTEDIPGKAEKFIKANGKEYFVNYRIEKHRFGQYIESVTYSENYIDNIHLLMASIVQPVKRTLWFKKIGVNDSRHHEEISNDMLQAKIVDVYHTAVFFYRVFRGSIRSTKDYLVLEMMKKGMEQNQATLLVTSSINAMDGFITPKWLPSMREYA